MTSAISITVRVPLAIRRRPGRKTVVTPDARQPVPMTARADPALVKALARAHRYQRMLDEGRHESLTDLAAAEKLDRSFLGKLLSLTLLGRVDKPVERGFPAGRGRDSTLISGMEIGVDPRTTDGRGVVLL